MRIEWLENITGEVFGGKANGLYILQQNGFNVPRSLCLETANSVNEFDDIDFTTKLKEILPMIGNKLAVRSSSQIEDLRIESKAGHFLTKTGTFDFSGLIDTIKEVYLSGPSMGIIIQELIESDYSGVFFSSNPITYSKKCGILSCIKGMGEKLVSGVEEGKDYEIDYSNLNDLDLPDPLLREMINSVKALENKMKYPLDIEWAIKDGVIYYLQCRPISSITSIVPGYYTMKELGQLPPQLRSHDKIKLRLEAQKTATFISDAYIHIQNLSFQKKQIKENTITPSAFCKGYSVVIVYPERVSDKVIRSFVCSESNLGQGIAKCYRYGIRSYPEHKDLDACLHSFHSMASDDYWINSVIIQELFDAVYTGVLRKVDTEYIIEITRGHFLTKGSVPTSQYIIENDKSIIRNEIYQNTWYRIVQGHVIECLCTDEEKSFVSLTDEEIHIVLDAFKNIMLDDCRVIEFGMIKHNDEFLPYLIDFVDSDDKIKTANLGKGIISGGYCRGRIQNVKCDESLNKHFHDKHKNDNKIVENIIFCCDTPNIGLLDLLDKYDNKHIGFVFKEGSVLCHLAVVLREKGVPAVNIGEIILDDGDEYILDAENPELSGKERLIRV